MDKRVTKTTIIVIIVAVAIIILVMGADMWFGIDLGIFKWAIFGVVVTVSSGVTASQAAKVDKKYICQACNTKNAPGTMFCGNCGKILESTNEKNG
jgi:DNA-directed RNA polymerase subunit RPC12/RpoP